ncbi:MAG: helix-turn-helix transcriptional regulator, partial [Gaiellaceae bacterium]
RGAPDAAAELGELALRLTPTGGERTARLLATAAAHADGGDLDRARTLLLEAVSGAPDGRLRANVLRLLGQLEARRNSFVSARDHAVAALHAAPGDEALQAGIELDLAFYRVSLADFRGAEPHAHAAVERARRDATAGSPTLSGAIAVMTMVDFLCGRGPRTASLARAAAGDDGAQPLPLMLRPRFILGLVQLWTGRVGEAVESLDLLRLEALEQGREGDVPLLSLYLVWSCLWQGDGGRAERLAAAAIEIATVLDDRMARAMSLSARALAAAFAGRTADARDAAGAAIALFEELEWRSGLIWPCWALGQAELAAGNPAGADAVLGPLAAQVAGLGDTDPVLSMFVPDEVEALTALGRAAAASSLLEPFEERASALDRGWARAAAGRCRGLLLAAEGDFDGAVSALEEALAHHEREMPVERARTVLELGRVERRRRQKRRARLALEEALETFERAGADGLAAKARAELARVVTRRAPSELTATEERIARLAAEGLTNRAIAERAFVAVSTVEANLKRAYRKLGITSRAQLSRALDRKGAQTVS